MVEAARLTENREGPTLVAGKVRLWQTAQGQEEGEQEGRGESST